MNVSRPSTAAAGRTAGRTTCQKTRSVWQPSTRAASISSFGHRRDDVLAHQEHAERRDEDRRDHRLQVVDPAEVLHLDVERDHAELDRDDQRRDHDAASARLLPRKLQLREREAGERAEEDDRDA